ncbi:MAG: hypothetical protein FJY06_01925 [Bacteroidetes bacterium]|nr:hypothetical protein [Bacteroidota bacterium]
MKNVIFKLFCAVFFVGHGITGYTQQQIPRTFLECNGGLAILNDDWFGVYPGVSYLIGQQRFFKENYFFEYQAGLSFPSIVTAKLGVGATGKVFGGSLGMRVFPNFVYGQIHFRFRNGQLNFSAEVSPFYNSNFVNIGPSFGANAIFTCGYQLAIGKSRLNKDPSNRKNKDF